MSTAQLRDLLKRAEGETLDFKQGAYDLKGDRNAFIKDILAMANTPRDGEAHIVLGVRWTPQSGAKVVGLEMQLDDAEFQSALGEGRVQPRPRFIYEPLEEEGKQVGILTISPSVDGPYTALKDYDDMNAGVIYYRRGTRNDRAVGTELRRIVDWFSNQQTAAPVASSGTSWPKFLDVVASFSKDRIYILCADRVPSSTAAPVHAIGMVPWRAVLDFDPESESTGLLSVVRGPLATHRVVHRVVKGEYSVQPEPGTHWFFARGLAGRNDTIADKDHRSWLKAYKRELGQQLERLASAVSPSPVTVVVIWSDVQLRAHLRTLLEELNGSLGELAEIVVVTEESATFAGFCEEAGAENAQMSLRSLCAGITDHFADGQAQDAERARLPTPDGAFIEIEPHDRLWFSEDLDIAYRGVGLDGEGDLEAYRRGGTICWRNLQLSHDCQRDITSELRGAVEGDLKRRQTVRLNLYHAPGAGGTTVGRRVLWDLHGSYPVAVLRRCEPRQTADRLSKVASLTESPVLVLVDGGEHSERDIDDLYEYLKAAQTPVVLLQVLRRFQTPRTGKRQFWLDASLTDNEADRFLDVFSKAAPNRGTELKELARHMNGIKRNAFFFGLTAFGRDFRGLSAYVERHLGGLTDVQRRIVGFIAIAHYYGQQSVPGQAFAATLGIPKARSIMLPSAFCGDASHALELLVENRPGEWRASHHLIAREVLEQLLSPPASKERESVWRQNLSTWAREFGSFCRGDDCAPSDRMLELVRRVFIYRDNTELLGTESSVAKRFAHLVEDIPSTHGKIDVLRHLTDLFPLEAHFHAHLGRFLGLNGRFEEALEAVDFAISVQPDDHVLHHIRGMVLRYAIKEMGSSPELLHQIVERAKSAVQSFEAAREISPDLEHGYISEVQLLIEVIDIAGKGRTDLIKNILGRPETDPFLRTALDRAEDLLDHVDTLYAGEEPSRFVIDCRARLHRIYGDFATSLQAFDNLLSHPEVARPPVRRQIVWTILRRHVGDWSNLSTKEVNRAVGLLEENLEEEVNDSTSLRLWLRAIRHAQVVPSVDAVIERVGYWKANTHALDAAYYLYVFHAVRALEGSSQALADMERALDECRALAKYRRDRTRSFEWIGKSQGVQRLVHQSQLGEWRGDFWEATSALALVPGRITSIDGPQKGMIELKGGLSAFFVPVKGDFHIGRDENALINCFVGFSYDGLRAWDVRRVD